MKLKMLALSASLLLTPTAAFAVNEYPNCDVIAEKIALIKGMGGNAVKVTDAQYRFMQGVFIMMRAADGNGPITLPPGDSALLFTLPNVKTGQVFFVDGDVSCVSVQAKVPLMELLIAVGSGEVTHPLSSGTL